MPQYIRKPYKFACRGLGLRHPPDLLPDGLYPVLHNMVSRTLGTLQTREGILPLNGIVYPDPIHSIRRLNALSEPCAPEGGSTQDEIFLGVSDCRAPRVAITRA